MIGCFIGRQVANHVKQMEEDEVKRAVEFLYKLAGIISQMAYKSYKELEKCRESELAAKSQAAFMMNVNTESSDAIANEEFVVYYQPKVHLQKYTITGAEALCRWIHDGEMMPLAQFIPILEQNKAICTLDFYMLEHICRDMRQWLDECRELVKVSVNLSRRHMGDPELLNHIISIIDKYEVPHQYIEIELTETTTDVDFYDLKAIVFGLQKQKISTLVDDFGVGYSSLNLIKKLPWNVIKIDKSFLEHDENNLSNYIMLKQVIIMAQDFYFDKPLPKEEFLKRIEVQ